jgi:hypothetical protein
MTELPPSDLALVVRTDFSDDGIWRAVCAAIEAPVGEFRAHVEFVSDAALAGVAPDQLLTIGQRGRHRTFMFVADEATVADPERPILVLDLRAEPGRTFRVIPSEMWGVENNLSLANMDFAEFADNVDDDGVFRGFRE